MRSIETLTDNLCDHLLGESLPCEVTNPDGAIILPANRKLTRSMLRSAAAQPNLCCAHDHLQAMLHLMCQPTIDLMRLYARTPHPPLKVRVESILTTRRAMTYTEHRNAPTVLPW